MCPPQGNASPPRKSVYGAESVNAKHLAASSQVWAATAPEAGASRQPGQGTLDWDALNLEWDGNVINLNLKCTVC